VVLLSGLQAEVLSRKKGGQRKMINQFTCLYFTYKRFIEAGVATDYESSMYQLAGSLLTEKEKQGYVYDILKDRIIPVEGERDEDKPEVDQHRDTGLSRTGSHLCLEPSTEGRATTVQLSFVGF
jgi:hypothetical protein